MSQFLAILFVLGNSGDYQLMADEMPWSWSDVKASLFYCIDHNLPNYQVELSLNPKERFKPVTIRIGDGKKMLFACQGHGQTVFVSREKMLFVADFHPLVTGCQVMAVDLTSGKQLWQTRLRGIGPVTHSRYNNLVNIETDGRVVIVRGNESSGRYVEILDTKTGKTVGHKVYGRGE
jgi:hypothetical protein